MSVLAIICAVGAPSVQSVATAMALETESTRLAMSLTQARTTAINRGHLVSATFTSGSFALLDTQQSNEVVARATMPTGVTLETSGAASFTGLGTLTAPLVVTLHGATADRVVRVGLTGMVDVR